MKIKIIIAWLAMGLGATNMAAQNIVQAEYFFDTDPGYANGTAISLPAPAPDINNLLVNANVSALSSGFHTLYIRSKDAVGRWSQTNNLVFAKHVAVPNQAVITNIDKAEYYFDADPGYGNGVNIPLTAATDISNLLINADVTALTQGFHTMYIRVRDAAGKWSTVNYFPFAKHVSVPGQSAIVSIDKAEYFFDTDPGYSGGVNIPLTASTNISNLLINADVTALPQGFHTMYIRVRDATGKWSTVNYFPFAKHVSVPGQAAMVNIDKAEYFFDTDPGYGGGVNIPLTASTNISNLLINADVTALPQGFHTMYIRVRDAAGKWSTVNYFPFAKHVSVPGQAAMVNIDKAEYFFDTDPGYGGGVNIPLTASTNISNLLINADVTALPKGFHTMYIRTRDSLGKWSTVNNFPFAKHLDIAAPSALTNISRIEYFIDVDPGVGNAIAVTGYTPSTDVTNFSFNAQVNSVPLGPHTLYVRTQSVSGQWSITNFHNFNGGVPLPIKLLSFDATLQQDNTVMLDWETAQEINIANYEVERSHDGIGWEKIGLVRPQSPNASEKRFYKYHDQKPGMGLIYYRLRNNDTDGKYAYSPVRTVYINSSNDPAVTIYPNPTNGQELSFKLAKLLKSNVRARIINVGGITFRQDNVSLSGSASYTFTDLNLPAGNYFLLLEIDGKNQACKFTVR